MIDAEIITWDDAEETLRAFYELELPDISDEWADIHCGTAVPNPRPSTFVVVRRTGGTIDGLVIDRPTLVTEAWSTVESTASRLANVCRSLAFAAARAGVMGPATIYDDVVEYSGPQNLPDPMPGHSRYTFTHEIPMRGGTAV